MGTVESAVRTPGRDTHEVRNQVPPLEGYDAFETNRVLREGLEREGGAWAADLVHSAGRVAGDPEWLHKGVLANVHPPVLRTHDRYGHRIDEVEFHPAYHDLMRVNLSHQAHSLPWRDPRPGAHVARAALLYLFGQVESGVGCPVSMAYSAVPALRKTPELAEEWVPPLTSTEYDPGLRPVREKAGGLVGMAMTEKQGGSDVRANLTTAQPLNGGGEGAEYELTGHKWFCSAPMCDFFLVLAQAEGGLSCFVVPRVLDDGTLNRFRLQRLKDKLGNRSNASSEVEFDGAWGRMLGPEGRGVPTIIEMVNHTRLDCVIGTATGLRVGVEQATWHAAHRESFGKRLVEHPLMKNVLADLCLESEAATVTALRLARAYDQAESDEHEGLFRRIGTAVAKHSICKRGPIHAAEALECLGGNGYIEEHRMARLYRDQPLNSVWEGSGNVSALDVLRAMAKTPQVAQAFFAELETARGSNATYDAAVLEVGNELADREDIELRARRVVEKMALALQASLLIRHSPAAVSDAYCASRLGGDWGTVFGTLPRGVDLDAIVERHTPRA